MTQPNRSVWIVEATGRDYETAWDCVIGVFTTKAKADLCKVFCETEANAFVTRHRRLRDWIEQRYAISPNPERDWLDGFAYWERRKPEWLCGPGDIDQLRETSFIVYECKLHRAFRAWREDPR